MNYELMSLSDFDCKEDTKTIFRLCSIMIKMYSINTVLNINKITSLPCTNLIISMTTGVTVLRNSPRRLKYNTSVHA